MRDLLLSAVQGFDPEVGRFVAMLDFVRSKTLAVVAQVGEAGLNLRSSAETPRIKDILEHIAAVEYVYQKLSFEQRVLSVDEMAYWGRRLRLASDGSAAQECCGSQTLGTMSELRSITREELRTRPAGWLSSTVATPLGEMSNAFAWFHVIEHEAHHLGQISMILGAKRRAELMRETT